MGQIDPFFHYFSASYSRSIKWHVYNLQSGHEIPMIIPITLFLRELQSWPSPEYVEGELWNCWQSRTCTIISLIQASNLFFTTLIAFQSYSLFSKWLLEWLVSWMVCKMKKECETISLWGFTQNSLVHIFYVMWHKYQQTCELKHVTHLLKFLAI